MTLAVNSLGFPYVLGRTLGARRMPALPLRPGAKASSSWQHFTECAFHRKMVFKGEKRRSIFRAPNSAAAAPVVPRRSGIARRSSRAGLQNADRTLTNARRRAPGTTINYSALSAPVSRPLSASFADGRSGRRSEGVSLHGVCGRNDTRRDKNKQRTNLGDRQGRTDCLRCSRGGYAQRGRSVLQESADSDDRG